MCLCLKEDLGTFRFASSHVKDTARQINRLESKIEIKGNRTLRKGDREEKSKTSCMCKEIQEMQRQVV